MAITSTHEDYIEIIWRSGAERPGGMRVTDLARELGCRLPTVTRTVRVLAREGLVAHESRGLVNLTARGAKMAENIAHRHDDLVSFLEIVLGLPRDKAETDACRLEHGLSPLAAERLHVFLDHIEDLPARTRNKLLDSIHGGRRKPAFLHLAEVKTPGWRG